MPFPNMRQSLEENGYSFDHTKVCPSCNTTIEMWNTPRSRLMPLDFKKNEHDQEICEPHFATCKNPEQYSQKLRDKKKKQEDAGPITP